MTKEVKLMHRTIADLSKEPSTIPTGVWTLRAIKLSSKEVTKKNRDGEEYETVEYMLTAEPVTPSASVNPDELAEVDPKTGKPVYDGARLFLRYVEAFRSDMQSLGNALSAMGFGDDDSFDTIIEKNLVRGKLAKGEIVNRSYTRNDKTEGVEQKVRRWADVKSEGSGIVL